MRVSHFAPADGVAQRIRRKLVCRFRHAREVHVLRRRHWIAQFQQSDVIVNGVNVKAVVNKVGFYSLRCFRPFVLGQVVFPGANQDSSLARFLAHAMRSRQHPLRGNKRTAAVLLLPFGHDCHLQGENGKQKQIFTNAEKYMKCDVTWICRLFVSWKGSVKQRNRLPVAVSMQRETKCILCFVLKRTSVKTPWNMRLLKYLASIQNSEMFHTQVVLLLQNPAGPGHH